MRMHKVVVRCEYKDEAYLPQAGKQGSKERRCNYLEGKARALSQQEGRIGIDLFSLNYNYHKTIGNEGLY